MVRISTISRLAWGLSSITISVVLAAGVLGLIPDRNRAVMEGRSRLCETTAIAFTLLAGQENYDHIRLGLEAIVSRNPELLTAAVRRTDGQIIARAGDHEHQWNEAHASDLPGSHMYVPIAFNGEPWGMLEVCFEPLSPGGWKGIWLLSEVRLPLFLAIAGGLCYWVYLRRALHYLDPSKVVPARVRQALDTLTEGLLLLDKNEHIVLANKAFTETAGLSEAKLLGRKASSLEWKSAGVATPANQLPWQKVLRGEDGHTGSMLAFQPNDKEDRTFIVNAAPILDEKGHSQGALTSFGDVTPLEKKKVELSEMLKLLQKSSNEIQRQNQELERLATEDPLTGCMNRRSFFEKFDAAWQSAGQKGRSLSCVMVDIDHFKSVNDNFGHSVGDEVLKKVAHTLSEAARDRDLVCRFGGEEFCVLMPQTDIDAARVVAERLRETIASIPFTQLTVTVSLGISCRDLGAQSPQELLDQADKCLYVAKHHGRNCVVSLDQVPADLVIEEKTVSPAAAVEPPVSFPVAIALLSALAYRDLPTAEHSRRVADLCVLVAEGLMTPSQCYLLEISALLHDIGKMNLPDVILHKLEPLSPEERASVRTHQEFGTELVRASIKSPELCTILDNYLIPFENGYLDPKTDKRIRLPLGSRILAIANSLDEMTSDRAGQTGHKLDVAFTELRRLAGSQFDAELVERFAACVRSRRPVNADTDAGTVSKEAALSIGMQIERLVLALDRRDLPGLGDLAGHLHLLANQQGARDVADQAAELHAALTSEDSDLLGVLHEADSLLKLCRATQRAYFDGIQPRTPPTLA